MKKIQDLDPKTKKISAGIFFFAAACMYVTAILNSTKGEGLDYVSFSIGCTFVCVASIFLIENKKK